MPESGWNAELGAKQAVKFDDVAGMIDLALFYSQNKDLIEYVFGVYPDGLGFRSTNIEYSRVYGAELEVSLKGEIGEFRNTAIGGYVYTYPIEFDPKTGKDTDVYLKFRRKHSFTLNLNSQLREYDFSDRKSVV